ncbi:MAG TPA: ABC transporter permease [Gemmatimonadaceae bacterium]|nr:ABC transporter permease [Gemmatimonadaceae bacterium]
MRRTLGAIVIAFLVATLSFVLVHAAPGAPFAALREDPRVTPEMADRIRAQYGLDRPLGDQYLLYMGRLVRGDFGESFQQRRPVRAVLADALPKTLLLMGTAIVVAFALGVLLGAVQAYRRGSRFDAAMGHLSLTLASIPEYLLAIALLALFAYRFPLFPTGGMADAVLSRFNSPLQHARDVAWHLVLPATTLVLIIGAVVARYQRAALLDVLPEDFVRTARAKGVSPRRVLFVHALRNAMLPTVTLVGLVFPALFGGAVFVESVYSWPGMGRTIVDALLARDYPLIVGSVFVGSLFVVAGGLIADLAAAVADPRTRTA